MKLRTIISAITLYACIVNFAWFSSPSYSSEHNDHHEEEVEKGPNNGRMLRDGEFAIELAIVENGLPPEFRAFAWQNQQQIAVDNIEVSVELLRLGGVKNTIDFYKEGDYLKGNMEVYEPHSFIVNLTAVHKGKRYQWSYENLEGRVTISQKMADAIGISTEVVAPQTLNQTLTVYGSLKLPVNAVRNISAKYPGEIKALKSERGHFVKKGQVLMTIESHESLQTYNIYAPISGVVIEQMAGEGEQTSGRPLLIIADTRELIAEFAVFPLDQHKVSLGKTIDIGLPSSNKRITSELFDTLYSVNGEQAKIYRAKVANLDGQFNAGQFVTGDILVEKVQVPLAVKVSALQSFRDFTVVFAKVNDEYEVRMLELGRKAGPWIEVLGGISAGTEYVTDNSYIIKADIDKSGAAHDH